MLSLLDAVWSLKLRVLSEDAWSAYCLPRSKAVFGRQSALRAEDEHLKSFLYSIQIALCDIVAGMENGFIFEQERCVSSAFIDSSLYLGIAEAALMAQDNLTECFHHIGCDGILYREKYNAFWVFTKTKLRFYSRPAWRQHVTARTFPVSNAGLRTEIDTVIADMDGKTLVTAKQEACVLDIETRRPVKLESVHYPVTDFPPPEFTDNFDRLAADFTDSDKMFDETIRSQHIDMSHHMNNIEYIKLALNAFTDDFLRTHDVESLEVHFTGESREGQILSVYKKDDCTGGYLTALIAVKESGRTVFKMKIVFKQDE